MKYQTHLGNSEHKGWVKIEVNLGNNISLINEDKTRLLTFLKSFSETETILLKQHTGFQIDPSAIELPINKTTVRFLLIKRFIDKNKPSVIAEALNLAMSGKALEMNVFLKIAEDLFKKNVLPEDIYAYCTFRRRGSPTTWLKVNNGLSEAEFIKEVDNKINSLCNRLTYRLHFRRRLRMRQKINNFLIYILEKPAGADVARTEDTNQEIQKIGYSILVVNIDERKMGYVSHGKREVAEAQNYIKEKVFPDEVFKQRNDVNYDAKKLLEKLLSINSEIPLDIIGFNLKNTNLPNSPSLKLESTDGNPINTAVIDIKSFWQGLDITSIKGVDYSFQGQKINIYSYGDDWKRRYLNVSSKGKSKVIEDFAVAELEKIIGSPIKETAFITEELSLEFIVQKILKDKFIPIDPPIPASAEKAIVELVKDGLLKKPRKIAKRRCSSWTCRTISWTEWLCPNCGRPMNLVGESITIELSEPKFIQKLTEILSANLTGYDITQQQIQRKKYIKRTIRVVNVKKDVAVYIVPVLTKKDLNFCEALSKEGYGLIAICDPDMSSKKEELELYGSSFLELSSVVTGLKNKLDGKPSLLLSEVSETLTSQEDNMLVRVQQRLVDSTNTLKTKGSGYDEDVFEIDLKNIFQALVPNVVRLGTKFKGKSVPDGYCSFRLPNVKASYLFG